MMTMNGVDTRRCLDTAHDMLSGSCAGGWWRRACACLIRLALERGIDEYWQRTSPPVAACASQRAKLLMLRRLRTRAVAQRVALAWAALSRATHHHCYELAPTAGELRHLHAEVTAILTDLRANEPRST
jgi:hypothetical protein